MSISKSFEAKDLYKSGMYDDVIKMYDEAEEGYSFNEWDYHYYSASLRKKEMYSEGLKISGEAMAKFPQFNMVVGTHCWCLYYLYIRGFNPQEGNERDFYKAINTIIKVSEHEKFSPYERIAWKAVDYFRSKQNIPYENVDYYLSLLKPDLLSEEPKKVLKDNREMEIESDREKWYSLKSKSLLNMGEYEKCISLCDEALSKLGKLHHDNDVWFDYRIAVSKAKLGKLDEAENRITELLQHKEHWVLYKVLFSINAEKGEFEKALKYASMGALAQGEHKHKMGLYEALSELLQKNGLETESYYHLLMVRNVREENSWSVNSGLLQKLDSYDIEEPDKRDLVKNLEKFWRDNKLKGEKKYKGIIDNIFPNGRAGFIKGDEGGSYYFKVNSIQNRRGQLEKGKAVAFYTKDSFDKSKQTTSKEAIEIILI